MKIRKVIHKSISDHNELIKTYGYFNPKNNLFMIDQFTLVKNNNKRKQHINNPNFTLVKQFKNSGLYQKPFFDIKLNTLIYIFENLIKS